MNNIIDTHLQSEQKLYDAIELTNTYFYAHNRVRYIFLKQTAAPIVLGRGYLKHLVMIRSLNQMAWHYHQ